MMNKGSKAKAYLDKKMKRWSLLLLSVLILSACKAPLTQQAPTETSLEETMAPSADPTPTWTSEPPTRLTICTSELPQSLFPYDGLQTSSKTNILAMLLEAPFEQMDGVLVGGSLEKVPSFSDGDLRLEPVAVQRGQTVVDAQGQLVVLKAGVVVRPSGCRQNDCAITWDGEAPLQMDQMVVDFQLKGGLTWSDGRLVTAADSRFSFQLASAPESPGLKWAEERTEAYQPIDSQSVQWKGKPGFTTAEPGRFFWTPLPAHLFNGSEGWEVLAQDQRLTSQPLSYGPFMLTTWTDEVIYFEPNPYYYLSEQGLPTLDEIIYRQVASGRAQAWEDLKSGACDMLDASFSLASDPGLLAEINADERFTLQVQEGLAWVQLVFGVGPSAFDDGNTFYNEARPNLLGDARTRQALAACLDRQALLDAILPGLGVVWPSFLPPSRSQLASSNQLVYDPALGRALLEDAGWRDSDWNPETPLQAWDVPGVPAGTPLSLTLLTTTSGFQQDLAAIIGSSLKDCSVEVRVTSMPAEELYAPGPDGPLFGRAFDLALISWQPNPGLDCELYESWQIPTNANEWIGTNVAGLQDPGYDAACVSALLALPEEAPQALHDAEGAFITALPALPLFSPPEVNVLSTSRCGQDALGGHADFFLTIERYSGGKNCP